MTEPEPDIAGGTAQPYHSPVAAAAQPGWYSDPWDRGQHRYWDGATWTAYAFPNGPGAGEADPTMSGAAATSQWSPPVRTGQASITAPADDAHAPPPPAWAPPVHPAGQFETSQLPRAPAGETPPERRPRLTGRALVVALVAMALVVGLGAMAVTYYALRPSHSSSSNTPAAAGPPGATAPTTPGTTPATPADPDAAALRQLVVTQSDVAQSVTVQPLPNGDQVSGEATLDLCNGNFPSESLRTARLQVAAADAQGNTQLSTEAVLYQNPAATSQAFAELRSVAAGCPNQPVESPVGEPTVTTKFNPAPDAGWPQVPTVDRQAYDFTTTDTSGQAEHSVAVYLRRGRALMGVYFAQPDGPQSPIQGQTTIPGIVNVLATRMAQLPSSVVNG